MNERNEQKQILKSSRIESQTRGSAPGAPVESVPMSDGAIPVDVGLARGFVSESQGRRCGRASLDEDPNFRLARRTRLNILYSVLNELRSVLSVQ